tara:strand:+ start:3693 stop:4124 length:432 start_codon:yes stop_codon:yes gene_type:complete
MSWYKTGTVTVTNGSTAVTGAGTLFVGAVSAGDAFVGPTGQVYEVVAVISATQLTISPSYQGSSQPGAAYGIFPTYAALVSFNTRLNALLVNYESVLTGAGAGKFLNGTAAAPGSRLSETLIQVSDGSVPIPWHWSPAARIAL